MGRVNLKMLNQYPGTIPQHLLPHLNALTPDEQLAFLEGHMRPGCVHLVVDTMSTTNPAHWDVVAAVHRLMAFDIFWRHGAFLMQLPSGAAHWHDGRIMKLWGAEDLLTATPRLITATVQGPMLPCLVSGTAARLQVQGRKPTASAKATVDEQGNPAKVLGRFLGKFVVNPDLLDCPTCKLGSTEPGARSAGEVLVPALAGVGVLTLEAEHAGLLSAAQPVVVASDVATQQDVCKLVARLRLQAAG